MEEKNIQKLKNERDRIGKYLNLVPKGCHWKYLRLRQKRLHRMKCVRINHGCYHEEFPLNVCYEIESVSLPNQCLEVFASSDISLTKCFEIDDDEKMMMMPMKSGGGGGKDEIETHKQSNDKKFWWWKWWFTSTPVLDALVVLQHTNTNWD